MSVPVSAIGSIVTLKASRIFPVGIQLSNFPDDTDLFDTPNIDLLEVATSLNGEMVYYAKTGAIPVTIGILPGKDDDTNLEILAKANRAKSNQPLIVDIITLVIVVPNGKMYTYSDGVLVNAPFGPGIQSSGRIKSKTYTFNFQSYATT